jgi:hypothetical protein
MKKVSDECIARTLAVLCLARARARARAHTHTHSGQRRRGILDVALKNPRDFAKFYLPQGESGLETLRRRNTYARAELHASELSALRTYSVFANCRQRLVGVMYFGGIKMLASV